MEHMTEEQRAAERAALFADWDREHSDAIAASVAHREMIREWGHEPDLDAGAKVPAPVPFVPFDPDPGRGLIPEDSLPNGETRPDPARSGPSAPDPFTARVHRSRATRSRSGRSGKIVTGRGVAPVGGRWDVTDDGSPVSPVLLARLAGLGVPRDHAHGTAQSQHWDLDRLANALDPELPALLGTDAVSWHGMHRGDIDAPGAVRHTAPDMWHAAVWSGFIPAAVDHHDRDGLHIGTTVPFSDVRDAVQSRVSTVTRRVAGWPVRVRVRTPRPRLSDVDAGVARVTGRDERNRPTIRWAGDPVPWTDETGRVWSVVPLVAGWVDASRVWHGRRLVVRGGTTRDRRGRGPGRGVRTRPDDIVITVRRLSDALPTLAVSVRGLPIGTRLVVVAGRDRLTISRADGTGQYRFTLRTGPAEDRRTVSRSRYRTAAGLVAAVARVL
jgi:hypothetical protein